MRRLDLPVCLLAPLSWSDPGTRFIQVNRLRSERPRFKPDPRFDHVIQMIRSGFFGWEDYFAPICDAITGTDYYLTAVDFAAYLDTQVRGR